MRRSLPLTAALLGLALLPLRSPRAADPARGKELYALCQSCHGTQAEGNKALGAPRLQGKSASYLTRQLGNFREGIRGTDSRDLYGMQMRPMAMTLADDAAVADVVAYIGSLPEPPAAAPTVTGDAARGKELYALCQSCHGVDGKGNEDLKAPALVGQSDWYLQRQLKNFKDGIRGTDSRDTYGQQMRPMALALADAAAIDDVVAYIDTLGGSPVAP